MKGVGGRSFEKQWRWAFEEEHGSGGNVGEVKKLVVVEGFFLSRLPFCFRLFFGSWLPFLSQVVLLY